MTLSARQPPAWSNHPTDMLDRQVARFFRALAEERLPARLRIVAVRLLGCQTAVTDAGQRTLRMLAQTLRLPVYGTRTQLLKSHSDAAGFNPAFSHVLVEASALTAGRPDQIAKAEVIR
ncbi:MAG TPA: hypothetical protein VKG45_07860 [Actinomycetes bacterium]|nr:hypothetical protein [Actinomycetes bacterium]